MMWVLDRFEEDMAVLAEQASGEIRTVPRAALPENAAEGDVFCWEENAPPRHDAAATEARRARLRARWEKWTGRG